MTDDKRKRSANWLPSEKELLLSLVEAYYNVIENKKTDGVSMKQKLAQWQIIAEKYNSYTTHCSRTGDNLKAQWESMKKVSRKDAANQRKHLIQTGGGSPIPPKKEDPFLQRILSLISTSAIGLFNPYDKDSVVPIHQLQDQDRGPIPAEDSPESPQINYNNVSVPPVITIVNDQMSDADVPVYEQEFQTKDWGDYTPQLLRTPVSQALRIDHEEKEKNIKIHQPSDAKHTSNNRTWVTRRRPTHTSTSSSLEQLHQKKMEAIDLQTKLAVEEMERSKVRHDLDVKIKKQILLQEKIKANILLIKRRKLLDCKNRK